MHATISWDEALGDIYSFAPPVLCSLLKKQEIVEPFAAKPILSITVNTPCVPNLTAVIYNISTALGQIFKSFKPTAAVISHVPSDQLSVTIRYGSLVQLSKETELW